MVIFYKDRKLYDMAMTLCISGEGLMATYNSIELAELILLVLRMYWSP